MTPTMTGSPEITYFKPSGRVRWSSFLLWLSLPLFLSAVLAAVLFWLFSVGHY